MKPIYFILTATALLTACQDPDVEPELTDTTGVESRLEFAEARVAADVSVVRILGQVVVPSNAQWVVGPSVEARLIEWSVTTGSRVRVGDTLATLVSPELGDLASVANELHRVVKEREKNVARLEESVRAGFKSSASLHEAELSLNEARAHLQRVKRQLGTRNENIRRGHKSQWEWISPVEGQVNALDCIPGGLYSAESRCITIIADDAPRLRVDVSEGFAAKLQNHTPEASWTATGTSKPLALEFDRRNAGFDSRTRTQAYYFRGDGLVVGASGPAELNIPAPEGAYAVPRMSVVDVQGQPTVFVETDGRPQPTPVDVIGRKGEDTLVTGIGADDRVVSRGAFALKSILAFE